MIISKSFAHSIKDFRTYNILLGSISLIALLSTCVGFVLLKNNFYQLIFLSELIIANFMMLVVFINQYSSTKQVRYVLSMCFLINESERTNENWNLELDDMINLRCLQSVSICKQFYTRIKIAFHNNCCETKDILYHILSAGVVIQLFFVQKFQSDFNYVIMAALTFTFIWELILVALGILIEMPRRIRQYFKLKTLVRRASQASFFQMQRESQLGIANQEGLLLNLLQNNQAQEEIPQDQLPLQIDQLQVIQNQNIINHEGEQIQCQICFEDLEAIGDIQQLQCHPTHIFHSACISSWFQRKFQENQIPSCPICRAPQNQ